MLFFKFLKFALLRFGLFLLLVFALIASANISCSFLSIRRLLFFLRFNHQDQAWFLDNTWSLLPESNEALRHKFLYTVQEFQFAVFKMHGFFAYFLKPELIFQQFRGVPTDEEMVALKSRAGRNIEIGRRYVAAKLLSVSVLSAFAELTGGDAPIS